MTTARPAFVVERVLGNRLRFTITHPEGPVARHTFDPTDAAAVAHAGDWLAANMHDLTPGDLLALVAETGRPK